MQNSKTPISLVRFLSVLALLWVFTLSAVADDAVWVRINHEASELAAVDSGLAASLEDYGTFQWGRVSSADLQAFESQGLRIVQYPNPFELVLGGERYDPLHVAPSQLGFAPYQADPSGDWHIVQFDGPIRSDWLRDLRATGVQVVQPLFPFSYVVWADQAQISAARSLQRVRWSGPKLPEHRVQPHNRGYGSEERATMALVSRHDLRNSIRQLQAAGAVVHGNTRLSRHYEIIHLDVAGDRYLSLAQIPGVYTVQYIRPEVAQRGEMSNQSVVGGIDNGTIVPGYLDWLNPTGYTGDGVVVGIVDGGIRTSHQDLNDRIAACVSAGGSPTSCTTSNNQHGTHVAAAVAGTGNSGITDGSGFLRGQGVAPGASVVQQRYNAFLGGGPGGMIPGGMLTIFRESALSGALLANNSWGPTGSPQGYDIPTMEIDFISRDALPDDPEQHPVLAVWSIMNGNGDSGGACAPSSLGSPDEAKNLFGVGSTGLQTGGGGQVSINDVFSVSGNSGHGPACDGRRVPDIVAPGCNTDSASSGSDTAFALLCGTSMASPVVTGAVALWAERYIDEYGQNPSPAMMKAVFIAAARNLAGGTNADGGALGHRPDRFQGFGRLDLDAVMNPAGDVFLMDQEVVFTETGQDWGLGLNAADPNEPMMIALTWTDAPGHGDGGTAPAWVNVLDLVVNAGDGETYLGNVVGADGWSAPGGAPDDRNNTEAVWLQPSQHQGGVDLSVLATLIAGDALNPHDPGDPSQDFAIACYNCIIGDPTFSMSLNPNAIGACVPDTGSVDSDVVVNLGTIGDYSGTVALSATGQPAGVSTNFDPASVAVPGASDLTLTIASSASAGASIITVTGNDGDDTIERELALLLDDPLTSGPSLSAPGDGASDLTLTPTFTWVALSNVTEYRIQVATDAGFSDLVHDEVVEGTSFAVEDELATGTEYFWRVSGINLCGDGEWSDVFSFTTRLEPVADFSATSFEFLVEAGDSDSASLIINNVGTGNLNFAIETDTPGAGRDSGRDFTGAFDPDNWELVNSPANTGGSVDVEDGPPIEVFVTGGDDGVGGNTDFQIEIPMDGTIAFSWGYQSTDSGTFDTGGYVINGTYTQLAANNSQVPFFNETATVEVSAGDIFAFRVNTQDGLFGPGVLGVTNFDFAPAVCGGDIVPVPWLTATPASGTVPQGDSETVTVSIDAASLTPGDYEGWLCVSTNDPSAELVPMVVSLTVDGDPVPTDPVASISPASFSFEVPENGADSDTLFISNIGDGELNWVVDTAEMDRVAYRYGLDKEFDTGSAEVSSYVPPQGFDRASGIEPQGQAPQRIAGAAQPRAITEDFDEGFENITLLPGAGWVLQNNSDPIGTTGWLQGGTPFDAHEGPANAYIAANFNNAAGSGTISNWLLTPEFEFNDGTEITFWTRTTEQFEGFNDRLQVRLSTAGASDDVGTGATDVGDFTEVLLEINPDLQPNVYPEEWTQFTITLDDSHAGFTGRIAFRYFVTSGGPSGSNSDFIGIDTFSVTQPDGDPPGGCEDPGTIGWLTAAPGAGTTSGGATSEVTVMVDADGLAEGNYEALLCVSTNDPNSELVEVPVSLNVTDGPVDPDDPEADISPAGFTFTVTENGAGSDVLSIANVAASGAPNLDWSIDTASPMGTTVEEFDVPQFTVVGLPDGGGAEVFTFTGGVANQGNVVGLSFEGDASGVTGNGTWASDTCMIVEAPDGTTVSFGSVSATVPDFPECNTANTLPWDFQGNISDNDGFYESDHPDVFGSGVDDEGIWTLTFVHGWNSASAAPITWDNVVVSLIKEAPEAGCEVPGTIAWLDVDPASGSTAAQTTSLVDVMVDANGLAQGVYEALLCVATNDPAASLVEVPVTLNVVGDDIFTDRFENGN